MQVELARGGSGGGGGGAPRGGPPMGGGGGYGRGGPRNDRGYSAAPPPNAEFRVLVTGLPQTASWQDLKDHMRKAGDVSFAQVLSP